MGISSIDQFRDLFRAVGVSQIYVKELAPKQDNDKNQIVLASQLEGLVNAFPVREIKLREPSSSTKKRNSLLQAGRSLRHTSISSGLMNEAIVITHQMQS